MAHNESQIIDKTGKRISSARNERVAKRSDGKANIVTMSGSPKLVNIGFECVARPSELNVGDI